MEGQTETTHLTTAVRTNGHGVIFCLKKFPAGTNKHYSKTTDNNAAQTIQRLKCRLN